MNIVGLGESLIDVVVRPTSDSQKVLMDGNPGGAPLNALAASAKLGRKTAYITKVGSDVFGAQIKAQMEAAMIDTSGLIFGEELTTLAIVTLDESGDRSFAFYRNGTADVMLSEKDIDFDLIKDADIFIFGSISLTDNPARDTTLKVARFAHEKDVKVAFDPNYRAFLWDSEERAIEEIKIGMGLADYVKVSEEEAFLLTGEKEPKAAAEKLMEQYNMEFLAVTLGAEGASVMSGGLYREAPTYDVNVVDTTGAGDAFWGAALHKLLEYKEKGLCIKDRLDELLAYANAAGAFTTTRIGAQTAQPDDAQIAELMRRKK